MFIQVIFLKLFPTVRTI